MSRQNPLWALAAVVAMGQVLPFADDRSQHMDLVQLRSLVLRTNFP